MNLGLTPRQLSIFTRVARCRSFSAAAVELHLAQSVVSRTVQEIERQLHISLLHRTTRAVELTAAGEKFLELADQILRCHANAAREFNRFVDGDAGTVDIAALPSVAAVLLPSAISSFLCHHPGVRLRIRDGLADTVMHDVDSGAAEIGIAPCRHIPTSLVARPLVTDRLFAVMPHEHRLAQRPFVRWRDLSGATFIALSGTSSVRSLTDQAMSSAGIPADNLIETANVATVGGLVAAGLGLSALPTLVLPMISFAGLANRQLIDPPIDRQLGIIRRRDRTLSPPAARFAEHLQDRADEITRELLGPVEK